MLRNVAQGARRVAGGALRGVRGLLTGAGAFGDPEDTFRMYAPPTLLDVFDPEEQAALGRQIQMQQRGINANFRPGFGDTQNRIAAMAQMRQQEQAAAAQAQAQQERMAALANARGEEGITPDSLVRMGGVAVGLGDNQQAKQFFDLAGTLRDLTTDNPDIDMSAVTSVISAYSSDSRDSRNRLMAARTALNALENEDDFAVSTGLLTWLQSIGANPRVGADGNYQSESGIGQEAIRFVNMIRRGERLTPEQRNQVRAQVTQSQNVVREFQGQRDEALRNQLSLMDVSEDIIGPMIRSVQGLSRLPNETPPNETPPNETPSGQSGWAVRPRQ